MAKTFTFITPEMGWANLSNTYAFLKNQDATTADEKIISYLDQEVQKVVAAGTTDEATIKARLRTNLVADKKCKFKGDLAKLHLVSLFDTYTATKSVGRSKVDRRRRESVVNYNGVPKKAFWQYTVDELKQIDGDASFYQSVVENIASINKQENIDRAICYFGPNYAVIMDQSKRYAMAMKKAKNSLIAQNDVSTASATELIEMTLEEKIQKGIPVVITPNIVRELIKLYPNVTAEPTEYTDADAAAYKAKLEADAEAKAKAAAEEAKAKAEAKAEREKAAAEAKAKREAEAKEALKRAENKRLILEALAAKKAAAEKKTVATPKPEAEKNYDSSPDMWAEEVDKENAKPAIIIPDPTPEAIIWERASKLRDEFARKQTDTIYVWDLETEFDKDIDEALEEITTQYPDNFLYDAESGEINFCPDEN